MNEQDPIELAAIASTFGASARHESPVYVGSIKPNVVCNILLELYLSLDRFKITKDIFPFL